MKFFLTSAAGALFARPLSGRQRFIHWSIHFFSPFHETSSLLFQAATSGAPVRDCRQTQRIQLFSLSVDFQPFSLPAGLDQTGLYIARALVRLLRIVVFESIGSDPFRAGGG